jgi:effector-binding domain-containing protein
MTEPHIVQRDEQQYAGIRTHATLREWSRVNALLGQLFGWLSERDIDGAGPPLYRYWTIGDEEEEFDVEVGVPVGDAVTPDEGVHAGTIPAASYVRLIHVGHPDRLGRAHDSLRRWAEDEGVQLKRTVEGSREVWSGLVEFYLTDPAVEPDPSRWRTEILYQIA